jgi:hypothetical protein
VPPSTRFGAVSFLKGLRRTKGARPVRKAALLEPNLRAASLVLTPDAHPDLAGAALAGGAGEGRRARRDMALLLNDHLISGRRPSAWSPSRGLLRPAADRIRILRRGPKRHLRTAPR